MMYVGFSEYEGVTVPEAEAKNFALSQCGIPIEFATPDPLVRTNYGEMCDMVVEWFYSGNWCKEQSTEFAPYSECDEADFKIKESKELRMIQEATK